MFEDSPLIDPLPNVPLNQFPQSDELPEGCKVLDGLVDNGLCQVEYREATYVVRDTPSGPVARKLYVLVPSPADPLVARYPEGGYPCVVFCQGSAWHEQHLYNHFADHVWLAQRGYVVASVQYRESDIAPFPAQMQDFKTAIRYLRLHADDLCLDPERIGAWGDSSGAHTVLMAAYTAAGPTTTTAEGATIELDTPTYAGTSAEVRCVVDWYGPTVFDQMNRYPSAQDHTAPTSPEGFVLGKRDVLGHPDWVAAASPISYVMPFDNLALPPTLIMHGDRDQLVSFNQSVRLYRALRDAGQDVEFYKVTGANHGRAGFRCASALEVVKQFLRAYL